MIGGVNVGVMTGDGVGVGEGLVGVSGGGSVVVFGEVCGADVRRVAGGGAVLRLVGGGSVCGASDGEGDTSIGCPTGLSSAVLMTEMVPESLLVT